MGIISINEIIFINLDKLTLDKLDELTNSYQFPSILYGGGSSGFVTSEQIRLTSQQAICECNEN